VSKDSQRDLRRHGLDARASLSDELRHALSSRAVRNVCMSGAFLSARTIACYISTGPELDTSGIFFRAWQMQKRIFAPVTERNRKLTFRETRPDSSLSKNSFGLWQPARGATLDARRFDLVIAPVVAFDEMGNRIGMGGGYYDRTFGFLQNRSKCLRPRFAGIAFECQKVPEIKANSWDVPLWRIFTEDR
jgi:5-formyltetrahydrofolate cyclo-ligase